MHLAGDHVLGDANAGVALDHHRGLLVHAGAVVAHVSLDLDGDRGVQPDRQGVPAAWIEHSPVGLVGLLGEGVQGGVEFADGGVRQVDHRHQARSQA